ncbi:hypothetical protein F6Y04_06875 [Bacillus megaterium]|nr:hypothetical protein [Priestia megaterium]
MKNDHKTSVNDEEVSLVFGAIISVGKDKRMCYNHGQNAKGRWPAGREKGAKMVGHFVVFNGYWIRPLERDGRGETE